MNNFTRLILFAVLAGGALPARASKLDLLSSLDLRAVSYKGLNFATVDPFDRSFFYQDASLGFILKDLSIEKEKGGETAIDLGIVLRGIGIAGSTLPVSEPFNANSVRNPATNFTPWFQQAYVKIYGLTNSNIALTAGRQPFSLGGGIVMADDGLGFTGIKAELPVGKNIKNETFWFEPLSGSGGAGSLNVIGTCFEIPSEGLWQFYATAQNDENTPADIGIPVKRTVSYYTGLRYLLRYSFMSFDGEAVLQRGHATPWNPAAGSIKRSGSAFLLRGRWEQPMGTMGVGTGRLTYGRGSGDHSSSAGEDEGFFPVLGHRTNGLERDGFGDVFGATLFDALGGTRTLNGIPVGKSGISVFGIGATLPPYRGFYLSMDIYFFEAAYVASGGTVLGSEFDYKAAYNIGERLRFLFSYGTFTPKDAYPSGLSSQSRTAFSITARF